MESQSVPHDDILVLNLSVPAKKKKEKKNYIFESIEQEHGIPLPVRPYFQSIITFALVREKPASPLLGFIIRSDPNLVIGKSPSFLWRIVGVEQASSCASRDYFIPDRVPDSCFLPRVDDVKFGRRFPGFCVLPLEVDFDKRIIRAVYIHVEMECDVMVVNNTDYIFGQEGPI
ncbi:auxin-responsive GH3 family protein [Striga asiatica]|uniref:Auxin-responsive GH3 family protein n=1 Tax=Striga asiatica TaxID=4170 RepID=A0A5A7P6A5_STRAF|nr:auxin-responsive GH3 family protein [Striga asiatica]